MADDPKKEAAETQAGQSGEQKTEQSQTLLQRRNLFGPEDENLKTLSDQDLRKQHTEKG